MSMPTTEAQLARARRQMALPRCHHVHNPHPPRDAWVGDGGGQRGVLARSVRARRAWQPGGRTWRAGGAVIFCLAIASAVAVGVAPEVLGPSLSHDRIRRLHQITARGEPHTSEHRPCVQARGVGRVLQRRRRRACASSDCRTVFRGRGSPGLSADSQKRPKGFPLLQPILFHSRRHAGTDPSGGLWGHWSGSSGSADHTPGGNSWEAPAPSPEVSAEPSPAWSSGTCVITTMPPPGGTFISHASSPPSRTFDLISSSVADLRRVRVSHAARSYRGSQTCMRSCEKHSRWPPPRGTHGQMQPRGPHERRAGGSAPGLFVNESHVLDAPIAATHAD